MCKWGTTVGVQLAPREGKKSFAGVDKCIAPIIQALNNANIRTVASCCGHHKGFGNIALEGGRELIIAPDYNSAREFEALIKNQFPDCGFLDEN